ncbi:hypothetical protein [Pseudogemmobacter humi]|uniref:Uncharacterized protein n=1 Tax=Pseudogemmobacter humi TaxID=2483812 RepID=A0A3P5XVJ6_9RHOB|nr:hypothetical protein [Pseudogemmobacter humi]VDC33117.1 hypothetical protein XINFAN_03645 [Pseudogemmobacter humi]
MIITLSPIRADWPVPVLAVSGAVLEIDGQPVDLAGYDAGADPHPLIVGQPALIEGVWHVTVLLPHGPDAPEALRFPDPVGVSGDGRIRLPDSHV